MTEKMWNELTPGQQAYLDVLARAGGEWVDTLHHAQFSTESFRVLLVNNLIEFNGDFDDRITPAGLLVWQQGQTPAEPDRNNVLVEYVLEVDMLCHAGEPLITTLINDHRRLREQVSALTAERDALKAQLESIEIHHAASWEAGYYAGFAAGKRAE